MSEHEVKCPRCRASMFLRRGQYGPYYPCSGWPACDVVRKANKDGTASESWSDGETRRARIEAHAEFDQLWKSGQMKRSEAYVWLAREIGANSPNGEFHIGRADKEECARVCEAVRLVRAWPDPENPPARARTFSRRWPM